MATLYFQKNDPKIQRKIQKKCQICGKQFNFYRAQHQCKRCLKAVCSDCSSQKILVYKPGFTSRLHRGCKICSEQLKGMIEFIESNRLAFGQMSHYGNKWMSKIDKRSLTASIDNRKHKKFTRQVFERMWDSYNYSFREFIGMLTLQKEKPEQIYKIVNDVFMAVISVVPEEDVENIAYLAIFMLCFTTSDKAPILCLFLIELKSSVINHSGLMQAVLKTLGMNEGIQQKMKDYLKIRGHRFINSFSLNVLNIRSSIQIIHKIISKRKIDEIYLYFGLSIDAIKQAILSNKDNPSFCDLLLVRTCTFEVINNKYKQANSVKTSLYLQQKQYDDIVNLTSKSIENSFNNENQMVVSFTQGIKGANNNKLSFLFNVEQNKQAQGMFRKRQVKQQSFVQDSFSVISMVDDQNQYNKNMSNQQNDLLNLMAQVDQKSPNSSIQLKLQNKKQRLRSIKFSDDIKVQQGPISQKNKLKIQTNCQKCAASNSTIQKLIKQINILRQQKIKIEDQLKKQKQIRFNLINQKQNLKSISNNQQQNLIIELQGQIKRLKSQLLQAEKKSKDNEGIISKLEQAKKLNKKQELEIMTYQQQYEEANLNIKMLKNKIESQSYIVPQQKNLENGTDSLKMVQRLKVSLREKNQQIQQLSKRCKLIQYQLDEVAKQRIEDKQKNQLRQKLMKSEKQRQQVMSKMKELSNLLMEEQSQKLFLSQQNFQLKEILKKNNIHYFQQ